MNTDASSSTETQTQYVTINRAQAQIYRPIHSSVSGFNRHQRELMNLLRHDMWSTCEHSHTGAPSLAQSSCCLRIKEPVTQRGARCRDNRASSTTRCVQSVLPLRTWSPIEEYNRILRCAWRGSAASIFLHILSSLLEELEFTLVWIAMYNTPFYKYVLASPRLFLQSKYPSPHLVLPSSFEPRFQLYCLIHHFIWHFFTRFHLIIWVHSSRTISTFQDAY